MHGDHLSESHLNSSYQGNLVVIVMNTLGRLHPGMNAPQGVCKINNKQLANEKKHLMQINVIQLLILQNEWLVSCGQESIRKT